MKYDLKIINVNQQINLWTVQNLCRSDIIETINNLRNSAIQSKDIIFILCMWQRGSLLEHNDSKSWRIDSKSWCHERQVLFLLKRETSAHTAPRTRAFINLRDDRHAWTDQNSFTGIDKQGVQK